MKKIIAFLLLITSFTVRVFAQNSEGYASKVSSRLIHCADSQSVVFEKIKVKEIKGIVSSPIDANDFFVVEIYKVSKDESKEKSLMPISNRTPFNTYEINKSGEFYIKNFPEGYYVLKFGTESGGWCCSWILVEVSKKSKDRKIEVSLELGV